jgi:hypothetical protein
MKTLYKIIVVYLFFSVFLTSCSKSFLNVTPQDQLSDGTFWKTQKDASVALTGIYNGWENWRQIGWLDMMSDIAYSKFPTPFQVMGNGQMTPANIGFSLYDYFQIREYNNFLEKIDGVTMDSTTKNEYKAEARFLRAYDYWRKAQYYGDVPLVTSTISDPIKANLAANPRADVIAFVLSELKAIIPLLPVQTMRASGGHATQAAALALKARCELFEGMNADAMADAKAIMDMGIFQLYPSYYGLFQIDNEAANFESIMEVEYATNTDPNLIWIDMTAGNDGGGYAVIDPTDNMVTSYEMANGKTIDDPTSGYDSTQPFKNRDPRLDMTILHAGSFYNNRYFDPFSPGIDYWQNANSFRGAYGFTKMAKIQTLVANCGLNVMVFRLAEVLLIYAEASIELNMITPDMYAAINAVRNRAGMPSVDQSVYNTQATLRQLVRRERKVELSYEGVRYYDIKRFDLGPQVLNGPCYGSKLGTVDPVTGVVTLTGGQILLENRVFHPERKYLLPIPQADIDSDPNLKQTPGY